MGRADHRIFELVVDRAALRVDLHDHRLDETVHARPQGADLVGKPLRQHGDDAVGEIDRRGALACFQINGRSRRDVSGDIGNVDSQAVVAIGELLDVHGVVEVLGVLPVDRDYGNFTKIRSPGEVIGPDLCGDLRGLLDHLGREFVPQLMLADDDLDIDVGIADIAEDLDDAALGIARPFRVLGDLGINHLAGLGAVELGLGNIQVEAQAGIEGLDVPEVFGALESADDVLPRSLEQANDFPLHLAAAAHALLAGDDQVAVHGGAHTAAGDVEVGLAGGDQRHDKAEAITVGGELADHEVHLLRRAVAAVASLNEHALL